MRPFCICSVSITAVWRFPGESDWKSITGDRSLRSCREQIASTIRLAAAMTGSDLDGQWMERALELAVRGQGLVEPNPMVGCVLIQEGRIVGEGWHKKFGGPH